MKKLLILMLIFINCEDTFTETRVEPALQYDLDFIISKFEADTLNWNPKNKRYIIEFKEDLPVIARTYQFSDMFITQINPNAIDYIFPLAHEIGEINGLKHGSCFLMTYSFMDITAVTKPWLGDNYLSEEFEEYILLIKQKRNDN